MANNSNKGYLLLLLHAHLPYVRHPEYKDSMEERWFYQAMTETYLPLIDVFHTLIKEGSSPRLTLNITPTLATMMTDPLLQERYEVYINKLIELAYKEVERTRWQPVFNDTARMYLDRFTRMRDIFTRYNRNVLQAFKELQDEGYIEIITCTATHAYLPNYQMYPNAVRAQLAMGKASYQRFFGKAPKGIWLAECGYFPRLEKYLKDYNFQYFFLETHGILYASSRPVYGVYAPIYTPSGVAAFGRDVETSKSVWSAEEGYPGDPYYREYYRDIGFDLDYEYIKPYIHESGIRIATGIKYYRVTGKTENKEPYDRHKALERAEIHAGNFLFNRELQVAYLNSVMDRSPVIVSPYDAELFGHWWFEGPDFLYFLFKKVKDFPTLQFITASDYLEMYPKNQVAEPAYSSWGYKGYSEVWVDGSNDWIYRHIHKITELMTELANQHKYTHDELIKRVLNQAAREVLLAQSSDWPFIMKMGTTVEYAARRVRTHVNRFFELYDMIRRNSINIQWLSEIEYKDNIFPDMDFRIFAD